MLAQSAAAAERHACRDTMAIAESEDSSCSTELEADCLSSADNSLPTPIAMILAKRVESAASAIESFNASLLFCEATIKYLTTIGISLLRAVDDHRAQRAAYELVRANSINPWPSRLDSVAQRLARHATGYAEIKAFHRTIMLRTDMRDDSSAPLARAWDDVSQILSNLDLLDVEEATRRPNLSTILRHVVMIRHRTFGHGAMPRPFYEEAAPLMDAASHSIAESLAALPAIVLITGRDTTDDLLGLKLSGLTPSITEKVDISSDVGSLCLVLGPSHVAIENLLHATLRGEAIHFAFSNGDWDTKGLSGSFLDYESGVVERKVLPRYGGTTSTPASSTEGGALVWGDALAHNLPVTAEHYIARTQLEEYTQRLLRDRTHRIITFKGPGGSGKTSLALKVCNDMVQTGAGFDYVLWISARDVDLTLEGPAARRRQVHNLQAIAEYFCDLMELKVPRADALDAFASTISNSSAASFLLVLDNFETLDDPAGVQRFIDEQLVPPSKALITSRHEAFKGDFPVPVNGMSEGEARDLIALAAREHFYEGQITEAQRRRIMRLSNRRPYDIKLLVAQLAATGNIDAAFERIKSNEDLLSALFDRSVENLGPDGLLLYLLLSRPEATAPNWLMAAVMETLNGYDYNQGRNEIAKMSLADVIVDANGEEQFAISHLASEHARRLTIGHELETDVLRGAQIVRDIYNRSGRDVRQTMQPLIAALERKSAVSTLTWSETISLSERIAHSIPALWLDLATALEVGGASLDVIRRAYKAAVEELPEDGDVWRRFAGFERRLGDQFMAMKYGVRSVECGITDIDYVSEVATWVAREVTQQKSLVTPAQRDMFTRSLIGVLESVRNYLDADTLSRLGWLYLIGWSPETDPTRRLMQKAAACAKDGLQREPGNEHCLRLLERT